ncbi:MAG: protease inhibitor I42 family protein [Patescibacteria group bacterium]|nr:protease inhibitor I42 family protein [Patescibacteria group bacterium]
MNFKNPSFNILIIVTLLLLSVSVSNAHISIGEYAGTHAVSFDPEPRSPFVGETVDMDFYLRDLSGNFANEPFLITVNVQKVLPDDSEITIFTTEPEIIIDGNYKTNYKFTEPGHYRLEFNFQRPSEPDISREGIFDIEVRDTTGGTSTTTILILLVLTAILAFTASSIFTKRRTS